jgi:hypothetical protein|tara:strand:- start:50 stop:205 length:156 start_codon:yes stop_codon:yes gene_type:complete
MIKSEDFEIQIKIAVYSTKGEFIKQHDATSLKEETVLRVMREIAEKMRNNG